jgi:hypothetical protein
MTNSALAEDNKKQEPISLFGSKPIQLELTKEGVQVRKEPGFICDLDASLGGGHYSEWGQTEEDARTIVYKKCSDNSGLLLCKKSKITCKEDK